MADEIRFYGARTAWGQFSNFAPYPIALRGKRWPTSEHYFQAQKFQAPALQEQIRRARSPMRAAELGRDRRHRPRRDWDRVKLGVMREAVRAKFQQHADLAALLLSTGDARLVEHTDLDDFWGDGGDGRGANHLGKILMEVRAELAAAR